MSKESVKITTDVDAETGLQTRTVSIKRGETTRKFEVKEISYGQINKIGAGLNHPDNAKRQQCMECFGANIVSACVSENGKSITFDEAASLPGSIGKTLEKEALALNNDDKEEAKNA